MKSEIRNPKPKSETNPNTKKAMTETEGARFQSLLFWYSDLFRISVFGFRIPTGAGIRIELSSLNRHADLFEQFLTALLQQIRHVRQRLARG
jgi:hypothetical protein